MPKRALQSQPEKKLKSNLSPTNSSKNTNFSSEPNHSTCKMTTDTLHNEKQDNDNIITEETRAKVMYLQTPTKSESDKKEYRVIKLENGLTALLIADTHSTSSQDDKDNVKVADAISTESEEEDDTETDSESGEESEEDDDVQDDHSDYTKDDDLPQCSKKLKREEKMAACGLSVGVGSFSDPPEIPGLAHFLEHMVFMGSEKYSEENDFDTFIKKRGGSDNASTECELTTFYFEIQEKHLLSALDRFAQFFIRPLMKRDAITREREAVESEFQMALPSDFCRKEQLFCSFAKLNHPATKFSWGNLITLRDNVTDEKLYEELHKFRERHYSAHRMKLAVQAKLPLDVLEHYVTECFKNVPCNNLPPDDFSLFKGAHSFDTLNFRRIYKVKPIKDVCQVELTWSIPPQHDLYKSKPHQYISWIIAHEGQGSLISYLRQKMWCLSIVSGNGESGFEHSSMYALFTVCLMLTAEGYAHLQEVLNATFSFTNLVRKEGPQKRIYDEIHQIKETNFRFTDEVPPSEYVEELCENMHYYPSCDYITGSELYFEYNPDAIEACLSYLTPSNVNIMILHKKFNDDELDKVEPWFNTKYTDMEIPEEWIKCWKNIEPFPEFHLPLPNPFLTDDFTLITLPPDVSKYPTKVYSDDIIELWHRPKLGLPECYMYFYIITPMDVCSLKSTALRDLYVNVLMHLLIEDLYPATDADLNYDIYAYDKGIILKVYGFSQKLPLLLMTIAKRITDSSLLINKELFEVMKEEQIKTYYNTFVKPKKLVRDVRLSILKLIHWTAIDRHTAIRDVQFEEFQNFVRHFTDHVYIQSLIEGNIAKEDAIKHVRECVKVLKCKPLLPNTMPQIRIVQISNGSQYCKVKNLNCTDVNSVVVNYYECGVTSIQLLVMIELLLMIMEEPLFNQLRTQEQLGYDVYCLSRDTYGILGYSISVHSQADKYTTDHVDNRIEAFLQMFSNMLMEMSEEDLQSIKEALIKLKQCADINLKEEVDRDWSEITTRDYMFDRIEREFSVIEHITIEKLREWMQSHMINGSNVKKLSVHVIGTNKPTNNENDTDIEFVEDGNKSIVNTQNAGNTQYSLTYVTEKTNKSSVYITNIEEYKNRLYCYPTNLKG